MRALTSVAGHYDGTPDLVMGSVRVPATPVGPVQPVNPWRRLLGGGVLVWEAVRLAVR